MFRLYSKGCEYALRALLEAASEGGIGRFQAGEVCQRAGIPEPFTRKVFQALVQAGFLKAARGPGGGYELSASPDEISLLEIIQAVDGNGTFDQCIMGLPQCGCENPCPLHHVWAQVKERLLIDLGSKKLRDLLEIRKCPPDRRMPTRRFRDEPR